MRRRKSLRKRKKEGSALERNELESAMEAILFAAGDPVGVERLCLALDIDRATADATAKRLADQYRFERRGLRIVSIDNMYQMCSAPEHAARVRRAFESRRPARLSQPALEVLAIIAYFQPTTRAYVDQVRGVDSSYTISLLLERELIEECGRLAVPGRPLLFRTTKHFLRSFGLSSLDDLPELPSSAGEETRIAEEMRGEVERLRTLQEPGTEPEAEASEPQEPLPPTDFTDEEIQTAMQEWLIQEQKAGDDSL